MVFVTKKNKSTHFCIDCRKLNAITNQDVFPLPRIDESLDMLPNTEHFSTFDLAAGYWQVPMDPESQEKTVCHAVWLLQHTSHVPATHRKGASWDGKRLLPGIPG